MEKIKKYWWIIVLFIIFLSIGYFVYKNKNTLKATFLISKQINQVEKAKTDIEKFEKRVEDLKNKFDKNVEKLEHFKLN